MIIQHLRSQQEGGAVNWQASPPKKAALRRTPAREATPDSHMALESRDSPLSSSCQCSTSTGVRPSCIRFPSTRGARPAGGRRSTQGATADTSLATSSLLGTGRSACPFIRLF
ncbi:unnamed protein product [Ixodes pacificus]